MDVYMEYDLNNGIPSPVFPPGHVFRPIAREEGHIWENVMDQAFGNYYAGDFELVMVENYAYLPERVYVLFDEHGKPCGTASAWSQPYLWGNDYGYIIFVGLVPTLRNQGLSRQMIYNICQTIKDRGQRFALLNVDHENLAAIKSYLNAGFLPRLTDRKQAKAWKRIFKKLKLKPVAYPVEILPRPEVPHPPRPWLLDLREMGHDVR